MIPRLSLSALVFVVAALIAVLVSTSGGSTSKARSSSAVSAISVKQTPLGDTLTDAQGRVLYRFAPDKPNMSTLSAAGRSVWPPFTSTRRPAATRGAQTSEISAVSGASGSAQITCHGHPLYNLVGDRKPGQASGQGPERVRRPLVRRVEGPRRDHCEPSQRGRQRLLRRHALIRLRLLSTRRTLQVTPSDQLGPRARPRAVSRLRPREWRSDHGTSAAERRYVRGQAVGSAFVARTQ